MKKILLYIIIIGLIMMPLIAQADNSAAVEGSDNYNEFKEAYETNQKITLDSSGDVTIYGKAVCTKDPKSCSVTYQGDNSKYEDSLASSVVCSNGAAYIRYQDRGSGGVSYNATNDADYEGTVYFTNTYYVTCTNISYGSSTVPLAEEKTEPTTSPSTGDSSTSNPSGSTGSSSGTTSGSDYQSSTTEKSPQTGITTYYIILAIVAIISYSIMLIVKKFNLFKKI